MMSELFYHFWLSDPSSAMCLTSASLLTAVKNFPVARFFNLNWGRVYEIVEPGEKTTFVKHLFCLIRIKCFVPVAQMHRVLTMTAANTLS